MMRKVIHRVCQPKVLFLAGVAGTVLSPIASTVYAQEVAVSRK